MVRSIYQAVGFAYLVIFGVIQTVTPGETYKICEDRELLDASFYMLPALRNDDVAKMAKRRGDRNDVYTQVLGEKNCSKSRSRDEDIMCPVYYELNMNPLRKPAMVLEARCSCSDDGRLSLNACYPDLYYREVLEYDQSAKCYRRILRRFQAGCSSKITSSYHR